MMRCLLGSTKFQYRLVLILGLRRLAGTVLLMVILFCRPAFSVEIIEGKWGGLYYPDQSTSINAEYLVRYSTVGDKKTLAITMVLDTEPKVDYTCELEDIKIEENRISFSIKLANTVKRCQLDKQEDGSFKGQCQAEIDPDTKRLTTIVMIPPNDTGNDNESQ
jgi:hypothetical protein